MLSALASPCCARLIFASLLAGVVPASFRAALSPQPAHTSAAAAAVAVIHRMRSSPSLVLLTTVLAACDYSGAYAAQAANTSLATPTDRPENSHCFERRQSRLRTTATCLRRTRVADQAT